MIFLDQGILHDPLELKKHFQAAEFLNLLNQVFYYTVMNNICIVMIVTSIQSSFYNRPFKGSPLVKMGLTPRL